MTKREKLAYIAGLFDGEGSVSIVHQRSPRKNDPENRIHRLSVNITNTKVDCLDFVKTFFDFGCVRQKPISKTTKSNWQKIYIYEIWGNNALYFLQSILSFCIIKKEKAKIAIKFQKRLSKLAHKWGKDRKWISEICNSIRKLNSESSGKPLKKCPFIWTKPIRFRNKNGDYTKGVYYERVV